MRSYFFALLAAGAALAGMSAVYAQTIEITGLLCTGDAEGVTIRNTGGAPQNMTGWKLRSDPDTEFYNLNVVGTLDPGEGMSVFSGPGAPDPNPDFNWFVWTYEYRYRDYDPTDYARVVNDQLVQVDIEYCPEVEPTPTPPPTATTDPPVGGVAQLPDVSGTSGRNYGALAALAAAVAAFAATGTWYVRRRFKQG